MLLSICIPSYNRFEKLKATINQILLCKSNDFEILVIDNCSPENINNYLKDINDSRLRIINRDKPIDGKLNVSLSVTYSDAIFSMILLDKDIIDGKYLASFISTLKKNDYVTGGFCAQNKKSGKMGNARLEDSIEKVGYMCRHPSGYFFKNEIIKKMYIEEKSKFFSNPFSPDILFTECVASGKVLYYDSPLILLETREECKNCKSITYIDENKVYFSPIQRFSEMNIFYSHLKQLRLDAITYKKMVNRLYLSTLNQVTIEYKGIMSDDVACAHHAIKKRKITYVDFWDNYFRLNKCIKSFSLPFYRQLYLYLIGSVKLVYIIIKDVVFHVL